MLYIGSVPYLNARPLLEGLAEDSSSTLIFEHPKGLHHAVLSKKVEVALLPVVSYLENPELKLIPGTGIVSHGEVKSVKVFFNQLGTNLSNAKSIYLTPESKTSQKLLKVLLVKKYHRKLNEIEWCPKPEQAEAQLEIGDKALAMSHFENSIDLGTEWTELTGLPFVYACWMCRVPITGELLTHLHNAKMRGLQSLEEIASRQDIVDSNDALEYLSSHIQYDIEGPELVGLKLFFDWVVELEDLNYDTSLRFVA